MFTSFALFCGFRGHQSRLQCEYGTFLRLRLNGHYLSAQSAWFTLFHIHNVRLQNERRGSVPASFCGESAVRHASVCASQLVPEVPIRLSNKTILPPVFCEGA